MVKVVKLPVSVSQDADAHARAETERKQRLFDWADAVLTSLGLVKVVKAAKTTMELYGITFDANSAEVVLAIREALHPASGGPKAEYLLGLNADGLRRLLRSRFNKLRKAREDELRGKGGKQSFWEDQLIKDKDGKPVANLANLILTLRKAPEWKNTLAFNAFTAQVVTKRSPPLEGAVSDACWSDHLESQTRV